MIHVQEKLEPADFDIKVRIPGKTYLRSNPTPTNKQFKNHRYWKEALNDLYDAYDGICAYSSSWIAPTQSQPTVEHYLPKDTAPQSAYDWSNYRLCSPKMNGYKDNFEDVVDPFHIKNGWFIIDFSTFLITSSDELPEYTKKAIDDTINRLKLNDDDSLVQSRANIIRDYAKGDFTFDYLKRKYPFLGFELERQNLVTNIKTMIR